MIVAITGSSGRIGRELVGELDEDHQLRLIDRRRTAGQSVTVANLAATRSRLARKLLSRWPPRWERQLRGANTLIHLAGDPNPYGSWRRIHECNIAAMWNVFEAAARLDVRRIIFASSFHAIGDVGSTLPDRYPEAGRARFAADVDLRPVTPYGVSKVLGEQVGRMLIESRRVQTFLTVRVGSFAPTPPNSHLRPYWVGARDIRSFFRRCVEASITGYHVVFATSGQPNPCDLTDTCRLLDWEPRESAAS